MSLGSRTITLPQPHHQRIENSDLTHAVTQTARIADYAEREREREGAGFRAPWTAGKLLTVPAPGASLADQM